jgi:hypothetical protein
MGLSKGQLLHLSGKRFNQELIPEWISLLDGFPLYLPIFNAPRETSDWSDIGRTGILFASPMESGEQS